MVIRCVMRRAWRHKLQRFRLKWTYCLFHKLWSGTLHFMYGSIDYVELDCYKSCTGPYRPASFRDTFYLFLNKIFGTASPRFDSINTALVIEFPDIMVLAVRELTRPVRTFSICEIWTFANIFSTSLSSGIVPNIWRDSHITPIPKVKQRNDVWTSWENSFVWTSWENSNSNSLRIILPGRSYGEAQEMLQCPMLDTRRGKLFEKTMKRIALDGRLLHHLTMTRRTNTGII